MHVPACSCCVSAATSLFLQARPALIKMLTYEVRYEFIVYLLEEFHHELFSFGGASDAWPPRNGLSIGVWLQQLAAHFWQHIIVQVLLQPLC